MVGKGGYRPNGGRPKGSRAPWALPAPDGKAVASPGLMPLEYMLAVMRDETADKTRRDRMAIAAAPFLHPKAPEMPASAPGKKERAAEAAKTAGVGSDWGDDLAVKRPEATN